MRFSLSSVKVYVLVSFGMIPWATVTSQTVGHLQNPFGGIGARATALGDAYSAQSHDVASLYWNPAALAFLTQSSLLVDYTRSSGGLESGQTAAFPFVINDNVTLALGVLYSRSTREQSETGDVFLPHEYGFDLGGSALLTYGLSIGVRVGVRYGDGFDSHVLVGFGSAGLDYTPDPSISYAFVYNGFLLGSQVRGGDQTPSMALEPVPRSFEISITMHYPATREHRVVDVSVSNEKIVGQPGLLYKGGVEVLPWQFLGFRLGYVAGPFASGLRCGLGFGGDLVQFAYALVPSNSRAPQHQLSLLIGH